MASLFYAENKKHLYQSTTNSFFADVFAYGFVIASTTCSQSNVDVQNIVIGCQNPLGTKNFQQNLNCKLCNELVKNVFDDRNRLEQQAHNLNPNYSVQTPSSETVDHLFGTEGKANGACKMVCNQCVFTDIKQDLQVKMIEECDISTESFNSAFVSGMSEQAYNKIKEHKDILNKTGNNLQSEDDFKSVAINVSNTIFDMSTTELKNCVKQSVLAAQNIKIDPKSTSLLVTNIFQNSSVSLVSSIVSRLVNDDQFKKAISYDEQAAEIEKITDLNDFIDDLEETVKSMEDVMMTLFGRIMLITIGILFIGIIISFYLLQSRVNSTLDNFT